MPQDEGMDTPSGRMPANSELKDEIDGGGM